MLIFRDAMSRGQTRKMHFIYLFAAPEHSESLECPVLSVTRDYGSFLCHQVEISFFALHLSTITDMFEFSAMACLESFPLSH